VAVRHVNPGNASARYIVHSVRDGRNAWYRPADPHPPALDLLRVLLRGDACCVPLEASDDGEPCTGDCCAPVP